MEDEYTEISTLDPILENPSGKFKLTGELAEIKQFIPEFNGVLDFNGMSIENWNDFHIKRLNGTLKNVTLGKYSAKKLVESNHGILKNITIQEVNAEEQGLLCQENQGVVVNCQIQESTIKDSNNLVGLICQENNGLIKESIVTGQVKNCKVCGLITGHNSGEIKNCTTRGKIYSNYTGGGIAGSVSEEGTVRSCESNAQIYSKNNSGGIIGEVNTDSDSTTLYLEDCEFKGTVSSTLHSGFLYSGENINSNDKIVYDSCKINAIELSNGSISATVLKDCDFTLAFTGDNLLFDSSITIKDSIISFKIEQRSKDSDLINPQVNSVKCISSVISFTNITDCADTLSGIRSKIDIINSSVKTKTKEIRTSIQKVASEKELRSCSKYDTIELQDDICITTPEKLFLNFYGKLEGNNYSITNLKTPLIRRIEESATISNLTIEHCHLRDSLQNGSIGFLSKTNYGTIDTVQLRDSMIKTTNQRVGGICGLSQGELTNISIEDVTIQSQNDMVGGLCGNCMKYKDISIKNCTITGENSVGGVCGKEKGRVVLEETTDNHVTDTFISGIEYVGGISGSGAISVKNSSVRNSEIHGQKHVGGLIGTGRQDFLKCTVTDTIIEGQQSVGGIVGTMIGGKFEIKNCHVDCNIIGDNHVGGISSVVRTVKISKCVVKGSIKGGNYVGGLLSGLLSESTIKNCYCTNTLDGDELVSGLVVDSMNSTIKNCFTLSEINSKNKYILGEVSNCTINDIYWNSDIIQDTSEIKYGEPITISNTTEIKAIIV